MNDRLGILNKRLKTVVERFETLKKSGIDEELLVIFISDRTKLSKKKVKSMLEGMDEFYEKLVSRLVGDAL